MERIWNVSWSGIKEKESKDNPAEFDRSDQPV